MLKNPTRWSLVTSACFAWLLAAAGCGGREQGFERYIAQPEAARAALEAVLAAWQDGQRPGQLVVGSSTVRAVDSQWRSGKKLLSYEILEQMPGENGNRFSVRLNMGSSSAPQLVNYVIVGGDQIWVFRDTDYAQMSN